MIVTLSASALRTALGDVLPLAGRKDEIPVLESVRLEADGSGNLLAIASDQYVVGVSRVDCGGDKLAVTLPATAARMSMKAARRAAKSERDALAEISQLEDGRVRISLSSGESIEAQPRGEYVRWRALIPSNPNIGGELRVDPKLIARFAHVRAKSPQDSMTLLPTLRSRRVNQPGMVVVRVGADFVGGVMPVRGEVEEYTRPGWLS